jgi:hypothetical protein
LKKIIEFLQNRGIKHRFIKNDKNLIVINNQFLLVPLDYNRNSNLKIIKIDLSNDRWIAVISKICDLKISNDMIRIYRDVKNNSWYNYDDDTLKDSWDAINKNIHNRSFKIIKHFHKSLMYANKNKCLSPIQFLKSRKNLFFLIKNRFIYSKKINADTIFNALSISGRSPIVSVFSPLLTKRIINQYYSDCKTIIDPFSGFSGRMLGSISLNKEYYGGDIRGDVIEESKNILNFINKISHLEKSDFKDFSIKEGDLLLTCPPYGYTELWEGVSEYHEEDYYIDWILKNYKCKKYIFIIKKTSYISNIVEEIKNGSWYESKNHEKILLFE